MKQKIAIIGGGPAGMMLACKLDNSKFEISIYEKNNTLGRKFLVAGKGGFNLTHSEPTLQMIDRYTPSSFMKKALIFFSNKKFIKWLNEMEIPTFIGTSRRVFPTKEIKPADVLKRILEKIRKNEVSINTNMTWKDWINNDQLDFNNNEMIDSNINIFALGGSSWKVTGSDGKWLDSFAAKGIKVNKFEASNGALFLKWNSDFLNKHEGHAIKNILLYNEEAEYKGELTITKNGIEGSPAYAMNGIVRAKLQTLDTTPVYLDLKPSFTHEEILDRLNKKRKKSWSNHLIQQINLSETALSLIKLNSNKEEFIDINRVSHLIKKIPLNITSLTNIDEAISTVGGVDLNEITENYELKKIQNNFVIGEMLDWDAPTGGYLLQACFSMGALLADYLNNLK